MSKSINNRDGWRNTKRVRLSFVNMKRNCDLFSFLSIISDLDECSLDTHNCAHYEDCYNTLGGFNCRCKSGLIVDSKGQCDGK